MMTPPFVLACYNSISTLLNHPSTCTMLSPRRTTALLAIAFAALLPLVASLSTSSPAAANIHQQTSRRDALIVFPTATLAGLFTMSPLPSHAMSDLSDYKDGPEGLKYLVLEKGSGPKPQRGQKIATSYTLWINGFPGDVGKAGAPSKQIDSSTKPILGDSPFQVRAGVSQVIRGWDLALLDMNEGESRRLVVPPSLGYGEKGIGPIPGKTTLYFEMKLSKVEKMQPLTPEAKQWLAEHPL